MSSSPDIRDRDDQSQVKPDGVGKPEAAAENSSGDEYQSTSENPGQGKEPAKVVQEVQTEVVDVKEGGIEQSSQASDNGPSDPRLKQLQVLRDLAKKPGKRLKLDEVAPLRELVDHHWRDTHQCADTGKILGKRLRPEGGLEAYKKLRLVQTESSDPVKKHPLPSIFVRKLQLPKKQVGLSWPSPIATIKLQRQQETHPKTPHTRQQGSEVATDGAYQSVFAVPEPPLAVDANLAKTPAPVTSSREELLGYQDFDINLCRSQREVQMGAHKCFERQLELVSLSYFGPPSSTGPGFKRAEQTNYQSQMDQQPIISGDMMLDSVQQLQEPTPKIDNPNPEVESIQSQQRNFDVKPTNGASFTRISEKRRINVSPLDFLCNPLRTDHPFEIWSPKEVALFLALICRYGKKFELMQPYILTKTLKEINEFYRIWKYTAHYQTWKAKQKDRPRPVADISDMIFQ